MPPKIPQSLGLPVSTRDFSLFEMVSRAWGSEFFAPDHRIYQFGGVRFFDSTDLGFTGIYSPGLSQATSPVLTTANDPINPTAIVLTWTLSTVYGSEIDYYNIFRSVDGGPFTLLVSLGYEKDFTTYTDSSLNPTSTYTYYVLAVANVGNNGQSNSITVAQATPPVLSGTLIGTTEVDLTWTAATVVGSTIANYFLYRQVDGGGYTLLTVTAGNVLAFNDLDVSSGHIYDYYVVAHSESGFDSVPSNIVTETTSSASIDALVDLAFISSTYLVGVTGTGNAAWSNDGGATTHPVVTPLASIDQFFIVIGGNGVAVAIGDDPFQGRRLVTTTDGITWTDTTPATLGSVLGLYYSALAGNIFIASDNTHPTRVFTSSDGVTWTQNAVPSGNPQVKQFTVDSTVETGGFIYIGGSGVNRSVDGLTFTNVKTTVLGGAYCSGPILNGSVFGVGLVAAFFPQIIQFFTSPDGTAWTLKSSATSPFNSKPYVTLNQYNGDFITGINSSDQQTFAVSPDAVTWTDHTASVSGFQANSSPVFLSTPSALYLFGQGVVHTTDYSSYTLDVAVTNTVNNMKINGTHIVGCGADISGNGLFFKVS